MTSDERIEIAERLRKAHGIMAFVEELGIDLDSDWCWTDVSKRVADLIDPKCHLVGTTLQTWTDGTQAFYHELSCGHTCETVWAKPPEYCEECGARVVDDD